MRSYMIILYYSFLIIKTYLSDFLFKKINYSSIVRFLIFMILELAKSAFWKWITIFNGITAHQTS